MWAAGPVPRRFTGAHSGHKIPEAGRGCRSWEKIGLTVSWGALHGLDALNERGEFLLEEWSLELLSFRFQRGRKLGLFFGRGPRHGGLLLIVGHAALEPAHELRVLEPHVGLCTAEGLPLFRDDFGKRRGV